MKAAPRPASLEIETLNLRLRMESLEERLSRLETFNLELGKKVARLERLQVQRHSIKLAEPGELKNITKRS
jgi:hypothetical protein